MAEMHIYNISLTGSATVRAKLPWERTDNTSSAEFRARIGDDVWLAYRHRTSYSWSWWEVRRNGKDTGNTGDLPKDALFEVPIAEALLHPCRCGCTARFVAKNSPGGK